MLGCCTQRLSKHGFIKFLCCGQYVGIIEISGAGIEHTTPQDGFHLFCHDCFNVIRPQLIGLFIIKNLREAVLHRVRCDGIAGGHINAQRSNQGVEPGSQSHTVTSVNIVLTDGRDGSNLEYHAIVQRNGADLLQRTADRIRCEGQVFQCGVQVHRCPVVQTDDGRHQHTALQNELLFIR